MISKACVGLFHSGGQTGKRLNVGIVMVTILSANAGDNIVEGPELNVHVFHLRVYYANGLRVDRTGG